MNVERCLHPLVGLLGETEGVDFPVCFGVAGAEDNDNLIRVIKYLVLGVSVPMVSQFEILLKSCASSRCVLFMLLLLFQLYLQIQ